jgi:hypothetical protein
MKPYLDPMLLCAFPELIDTDTLERALRRASEHLTHAADANEDVLQARSRLINMIDDLTDYLREYALWADFAQACALELESM